jgi:hypothetical protein
MSKIDKTVLTFVIAILAIIVFLVLMFVLISRDASSSTANNTPVPSPTYTYHSPQDAKQFATQHGCGKFKYGGSFEVGTCFIGTQKFQVVTFSDRSSRVFTQKATRHYHYHYLVVANRAMIYYYIDPGFHS